VVGALSTALPHSQHVVFSSALIKANAHRSNYPRPAVLSEHH